MMLDEGLYTYLAAKNTSAGNRIYPKRLPQGATLPAVVYLQVTAGIDYVQSGESALRTPRYQLDCWAVGGLAAKNLANEIQLALSAYKGPMGSETVQAGFIEGRRDDDDLETGRDRISLDVTIHHKV